MIMNENQNLSRIRKRRIERRINRANKMKILLNEIEAEEKRKKLNK